MPFLAIIFFGGIQFMNAGNNIFKLRSFLKLSMNKFGIEIGLSAGSINDIEKGKNIPTEQTIKLICLTYNVREEWLRTGKGEMFDNTNDALVEFLKQNYALDDLDLKIVKSYLKLSKESRQAFKSFLEQYKNEVEGPDA